MKNNPRYIGDDHVKSVQKALSQYIHNQSIQRFPNTVIKTVNYIGNMYPNIEKVTSKFDTNNPDQETDLALTLTSNKIIHINLFLIKKGRRIQPKNPGAKSFFSKYFLSANLQELFNQAFEINYQAFLKSLITQKIGIHYIKDKRELRKMVRDYYPKFTDEIVPYKDDFLYSLRETAFSLLKDFYNNENDGFFHAYNTFFMTKDINIITSYGKDPNDVHVEPFSPGTPHFDDIQIYKVGKNTVGIKYGTVALTLRFKFESGPISSIKLAASYDTLRNASEIETENTLTIQKISALLDEHHYIHTSNSSNAIGKAHEALTYYYFLKEFPSVTQVDPNECIDQVSKYYCHVKPEVLEKLYTSTSTVIPIIREKLKTKYESFQVDSIELVPDSYIEDRLNTGDLQLILKVEKKYVIENISLKAISNKGKKITTKNPGIGTILGPTYFNTGSSMNPTVNEVKTQFQQGELNHKKSLEIIAAELGMRLKDATQDQLKQGIENLLGKAMMCITIYEDNVSYCKEYSKINSAIRVYQQTPSAIQNTLAWNNDSETINLRAKFSRGQSHGWSTIKLTSEYQLK